jgi:hypothetical protein
VKYWEIIADTLKKAGWSLGYVSAIDSEGRTIWITDAHRDNGKRFVVRSEEKLTAFLDLERVARDEVKPHRCAVFLELGSVVTVEPKWSLDGEWPLRQFTIICHCRV